MRRPSEHQRSRELLGCIVSGCRNFRQSQGGRDEVLLQSDVTSSVRLVQQAENLDAAKAPARAELSAALHTAPVQPSARKSADGLEDVCLQSGDVVAQPSKSKNNGMSHYVEACCSSRDSKGATFAGIVAAWKLAHRSVNLPEYLLPRHLHRAAYVIRVGVPNLQQQIEDGT
eukprot:4497771-Amphidinium_carterae.1